MLELSHPSIGIALGSATTGESNLGQFLAAGDPRASLTPGPCSQLDGAPSWGEQTTGVLLQHLRCELHFCAAARHRRRPPCTATPPDLDPR